MISIKHVLIAGGLAAAVTLIGCGMNEEQLAQAQQRIEDLTAKGVPDSVLSKSKIFLFQVKAAQKTGSAAGGHTKKSADSLIITLDAAEQWYNDQMTKLKPAVSSLREKVTEAKGDLTGLQLATADSIIAVADSFTSKNWLLQANENLQHLDSLTEYLHEAEEKAQEVKKKIAGTKWVSYMVEDGPGLNAREIRTYNFGRDGSIHIDEKKSGKSSKYFKEDWHFISDGKYDVKNDTIFFRIAHEKCPKQTFWKYHHKKKQWIREDKRTYDNEITDGSKDRHMTFEDLQVGFKKRS
ncbi:MAG: hypothetical protein ACOC4C_00130 [Fibrobacterota bacterium]